MNVLSHELYVGRDAELDRARSALDRAFQGNGQTLAITGEPGIGKSTFLEHIASLATEMGGTVLYGRCFEEQGSPAYWPWNAVIRSHLLMLDETVAADLYADQSGRMAQAFPTLSAKSPNPRNSLDKNAAADERFLLHDEVASTLQRSAEIGPVLLLLDDMHWADEASLLLLEFLSKVLSDSRVLIGFTFWDVRLTRDEPLQHLLGGLSRERSFHRVHLRPLDRESSDSVVASAGMPDAPEEVKSAIFQATQGNPFFITEVTQLIRTDTGSAREPVHLPDVPETVVDMVARRLASMSTHAVSILETAAVIGVQFDLAVLTAATDADTRPLVMERLEEAEAARIVEAVPDSSTIWQFNHGLIRRALVSDLSPTRRIELHAAVFNALEEVLEDNADEHAAEMVEHSLQSESLLSADKVVHYSMIAGERSMEAHLPGVARRHFEAAMSRMDMDQCDVQTAKLLSGYSHSVFASGASEEIIVAARNSKAAVECYIELKMPYEAALHLAIPIRADYGLTGAAEMIRSVVALIDPDSREAGLLHAALIIWSYLDEFDIEASMASYENAMKIAGVTKDEHLKLICLANSGTVFRHYGDRVRDVEAATAAAELAMRLGLRYAESQARFVTATGFMFDGQMKLAQSEANRGLKIARDLNNAPRLVGALVAQIELALMKCEFDSVRKFGREALELDPGDHRVLRDLACTEFLTGNFDRAQSYLQSLIRLGESDKWVNPVGHSGSMSIAAAVGAAISEDPGYIQSVKPWLNPLLESPSRDRLLTAWGEAQPIVGLFCTRLEPDPELAAELLGESDTPILWKWLRASIGSVALMAGNERRARAEFESSYELFRKENAYLPLAWACLEYSDALLRLNQPKDLVLINELQYLGIEIAQKHGMTPIEEMLESARDGLVSGEFHVAERPAGLTTREIEVLREISNGLSNSEIAEKLIISTHTVNRHISNVFTKLGVSNRASATDMAHRLNLV